jgi:hypothetical protein
MPVTRCEKRALEFPGQYSADILPGRYTKLDNSPFKGGAVTNKIAATLNPRTVGLFGTCGGSTWRDPFMHLLDEQGIAYFNPQVDNWTPELADIEAWHLANDRLILFPVTDETFGFGSLAETGFSLQSALALNTNRFVMLYIAPAVNAQLAASSPEQADASRRARKLAMAHLAKAQNPNVFVATSLEDMQSKMLRLYAALELLDSVRGAGTDWRSGLAPAAWLEVIRTVQDPAAPASLATTTASATQPA